MANLILNGSTSGSITLSSPAVSGTTTLTLPTTSGTVITTGSTFAGTGPAFSVYLSANQSITTATTTKIAFNTELFDTNSNFDTSTYRFTPTVAGYYNVGLTCSYLGTAVTRFIASIFKNGSEFYRVSDSNGDVYLGGSSQVIYMNGTTDYIEFYGSVSGTAVSFEGVNTYRSNAFGCLVRSA
jgi:hypothetical protein